MKRIISAATLLIVFGFAVYIHAAPNHKKWARLIDNIYYQSASEANGIPYGAVTFRIFGSGDSDRPADFIADGNITHNHKGNKEYTFAINNGKFEVRQNGTHIIYEGSFAIDISYSKADKCTKAVILFTGGKMDYNGRRFPVIADWSKDIGLLELLVEDRAKGLPRILIKTEKLNLPVIETRGAKISQQLLHDIAAGTAKLQPEDSVFVYSVLPEGTSIIDFPAYQEINAVMRSKSNPGKVIGNQTIGYSLGNTMRLSGVTAVRNGDLLTLTIHNAPGMADCTAIYQHMGDPVEGELTSVKWGSHKKLDRGVLTRTDGSKISYVRFDPAFTHNSQGFVLSQIKTLETMTNPSVYDLTEFAIKEGLIVDRYISPEGTTYDIIDNRITKSNR